MGKYGEFWEVFGLTRGNESVIIRGSGKAHECLHCFGEIILLMPAYAGRAERRMSAIRGTRADKRKMEVLK